MDRKKRKWTRDREISGELGHSDHEEVFSSSEEETEDASDIEADDSHSGSEESDGSVQDLEEIDGELRSEIMSAEGASANEQPSTSGGCRKSTKRKRSHDPNSNKKTVVIKFDTQLITGKNGRMWKSESVPLEGKTSARDIAAGPINDAVHSSSSVECFGALFSPDIVKTVIQFTNEEIQRQRYTYTKPQTYTEDLGTEELKALLGILVMAAGLKDNHLRADVMWDTRRSGERYHAMMSRPRFSFLINCLRFDDRNDRCQRVKTDKLAPISEIWEKLVTNCESNYRPSSYVTIDEQLVGFRGRCSFRIGMPSRSSKYGIKIFMMCDSVTKYMLSAKVHLGKESVPQKVPLSQRVAAELVEPIRNTNRNVTCDSGFGSVPLAETLFDDYKLTFVGSTKLNEKDFPRQFSDPNFKNRPPGSSLFLFSGNVTAVSYKPAKKKTKLVCAISTLHEGGTVSEKTGKPEIIARYDSTKGAVRTFDRVCRSVNCGRKTKRWPLCLFYNIVNIAVHNSYVLYLHNYYRRNGEKHAKPLSRFDYVMTLADELSSNWMHVRLAQHSPIDLSINKYLKIEVVDASHGKRGGGQPQPSNPTGGRKVCSICHYTKRRMTKSYCTFCRNAICGEHQHKICSWCFKTYGTIADND